mmetsp:Transcript_53495/g.124618  ORF Transcript_53495/g.124618 Transcript_53495/m.124618 type:complete len:914 (+) Transcript_53495:49-2790(+)
MSDGREDPAEFEREGLPEEETLDDTAGDEEEGEGEDLMGENMMEDYRPEPELDHYDEDMIDDGPHERLTIQARLAAEREMQARDRREGRFGGRSPLGSPRASPAGVPEGSPTRPLRPARDSQSPRGTPAFTKRLNEGLQRSPSSAAGSSEFEVTSSRKKRRVSNGLQQSEDVEDDEDVPESQYDLGRETLTAGADVEKRLADKIRLCFEQFLLKFVPDGQTTPKYPDALRKMAEEYQAHLEVNFHHIEKWSGPLSLWISDFPRHVLPLLNETLLMQAARRFQTYNKLAEAGENELRVAISNYPVKDPIRGLCTRHINKLVHVTGVVTKRTGVFNQVKRLWVRCAKCNYAIGPFDVAEDSDLRPSKCLDCQSKGPWKVDRQQTIYQNYQKITLQESPSSVDPGKMPRSREVVLTGDLVDAIRPGDELDLTGIYRCLHDAATNARTCFPVYRTDIQAVHVCRRGDLKLIQITDDQQSQILELAKSPQVRERFISSMAPSIYGMWHVKTAIALSIMGGQPKIAAGKHRIRGDINTLIVGDPGLAKSQFLKYVEQTFPRAVYTTGKGASAVGLTAAVTRDETGHWCLEGGAMVLADDGICLIDEFDKMNDQDRTSLHEAMEQQSISISKAGIVATLQARCAVVAVANPIEGRYDPGRTFSQNVNLSDPILSRFDLMCVLRDESDPVQDEMLADHVVCSHIRSHPDATTEEKNKKPRHHQKHAHQPISQDLLKKYIVYARQKVFPKMTDVDAEKLASFYSEMRAEAFRTGGAPMTARHMDSLVRLAEANARIELRQHVNSRDIDNAIAVMLESFIQSQKHQVAEELRKKFRRYLAQGPMGDQIILLLEKLFKQKVIQQQLRRPGKDVEISEVFVEMPEVVREIENHDLAVDDASTFMQTPRFLQHFRLDGENRLYRCF